MIKSKLELQPQQSIYVLIDDYPPQLAETMESVYNKYKSDDGFLYINYYAQNTFG